jgi:DNA invertase Pin-like site-specific DNA recombinase
MNRRRWRAPTGMVFLQPPRVCSLRATGRMIAGVLASLAELELELQRERRTAAKSARKARGLPIGRPKALDPDQIALAQRMRDNGEPVPVIAETLGVSRATLYRTLAEQG